MQCAAMAMSIQCPSVRNLIVSKRCRPER